MSCPLSYIRLYRKNTQETHKAYNSIKQKDADGVEPMYRPHDWNRQSRKKMKKCKRESWFKTGGPETVIYIPNTPGSVLKNRYMKEVGKSGLSESGGGYW